MDEDPPALIEGIVYESARGGQVNEEIVVLGILDRYCQVIRARRWILWADGDEVGDAMLLAEVERLGGR